MRHAGFHDRTATASRWLMGALVVVLLVHAGVLAVWLSGLLQRPDATVLRGEEFLPLIMRASAVALLALLIFRRSPRRTASIVAVAAACALVGVGPVATVVLMTLSAHVIGTALLDWSGSGTGGAASNAPASAAIRILTGSCIWMGLIGATISLPIHDGALYVIFAGAPLALFPGATRMSVANALKWLAVDDAWSPPERLCLALAVVIAIMHLIVVAKPEVGYDATAMHLQFADLVRHGHRWDFDVTRYAWAVMPMGADDAYLAAYLVDGEAAARLLNLIFGLLLCAVIYDTVRMQASRLIALVSVCLLASTPLWLLESSTLFVEYAWTAFLVAALASTLQFVERREATYFAAAALCCAGAMACKVIGVLWVVPLAVVLLYRLAHERRSAGARLAVVSLLGVVIASWPYGNAWVRTGNPVFPFMNTLFASPLFPAGEAFNNPVYNAPLSLATPYALVMHSGRYLEGYDGAAGIQWLLLFPLIAFGLFTRSRRRRSALFCLAVGFAVLVYAQQSYLRYLFPAFVLLAILAGWALGDLIRSPRAAAALAVATSIAAVANLWLMPSASWTNATLCIRCSQDADARRTYVARYAPLRLVADYLNRNLPHARVGFFVLNAAGASGFVGYSRAANWHDNQVFRGVQAARTSADVAAIVRRFRLTHAVFVDRSDNPFDHVLIEYRDRETTPVARIGNYVITAIRANDARAASAAAPSR
jgi:hypothetical protein